MKATVEGFGSLPLTTSDNEIYLGAVDTDHLGDGFLFPLILVGAEDLEGNYSEYSRRFGVDNRLNVRTDLSHVSASAGTEITATCVFERGGDLIAVADSIVTVSPNVPGLEVHGQTATFTPTVSGDYRGFC